MPRDTAKTREIILHAAGTLFYAEGIRPVSMDRVAEQAGVTKPTLYNHFHNKDELVAAYLDARNDLAFADLVRAVDGDGLSLAGGVARIFQGLAAWGQTPDARGCPFARAASELAGEPDHPAVAAAARFKSRAESWLAARCTATGVGDPGLLASQLMVLIDGALTQMMVHRDARYAEAAGKAAKALVSRAMDERHRQESEHD